MITYKKNMRIDTSMSQIITSGRALLVIDNGSYEQGVLWGTFGQKLFNAPNGYWVACTMTTAEFSGPATDAEKLAAYERITKRLIANCRVPVLSRVISALNELDKLEGGMLNVRMIELGLVCGCSRKVVAREVSYLIKQGLIQRSGHAVKVLYGLTRLAA